MATPPAARTVPALVLTYGPSGSGKTTDSGFAFPNALFIASRGSLTSISSECGYEPKMVDAQTIDEATARLREASNKVDAVVVDDYSFLAEQTFADYEKKYSGFKMWGALRDATLAFRNAARYAGCHVMLNCWEQAPKTRTDGSFLRGGPMLSGRLPEQMPAMCDLVLRCGHDSMRKPWTGTYKCEYSPRYVQKDRFGICYALSPAPMNLGEILRAAGYSISRRPDLPWQEEVVEQFSQELLSTSSSAFVKTANDLYGKLVSAGIDPIAARWTLRDAADRTVIRRALNNRNARFIA